MPETPGNGGPPQPIGMVQVEVIDMQARQVHLPYMHPNLPGQQFLNLSFDQFFGLIGLMCNKFMAEEQARAKGAAAPAGAPPQSPILKAGAAPALTPAQLAEIARKAREDRRA
jgi:hypothetical protein